MIAVTPISPHAGGMDLDWLWEDRPGEQVPPRPLSRASCTSTPRQQCSKGGKAHRRSATVSQGAPHPALPSKPNHAASRVTLARVAGATAWEVATWRGPKLLESHERFQNEAVELGRHFRDIELMRAAEDRERASKWARWQEIRCKRQLETEKESLKTDLRDSAGASSPSTGSSPRASTQLSGSEIGAARQARTKRSILPVVLPENPNGEGADPSQAAALVAEQMQTGSFPPHLLQLAAASRGQSESSATPRQAQRRSSKSAKSERIKSRLATLRSAKLAQKLLDVRQQEFEELPPQRKGKLKHAFDTADKNSQGLDGSQLRVALTHLGLVGKSKEEKQTLTMLINQAVAGSGGKILFFDFAFNVVPAIELKMYELMSPKLVQEFNTMMKSDVSSIKEGYVQNLRLHAKRLVSNAEVELLDQFFQCWNPKLTVQLKEHHAELNQFHTFEQIAKDMEAALMDFRTQIELRVAISKKLPPRTQALHSGELALLSRHFDKFDSRRQGVLFPRILPLALMATGTLPIVGKVHVEAMQTLLDKVETNKFEIIRFADFLHFIGCFRKHEKTARESIWNSFFLSRSWTSNKQISHDELPRMLLDLGLLMDCCRHEQEVAAILEDCNKDGNTSLSLDEVLKLTDKVVERARVIARQREYAVAQEYRLSDEQLLQLYISFSEMTGMGVIGASDISQLLEQLFSDSSFHEARLLDLLEEFLPPDYLGDLTHKDTTETDAEEDEMYRIQMHLEAFNLRFDGFVHIVGNLLQPQRPSMQKVFQRL